MIITSVTNLVYANQTETAINCELVTADLGAIPYTVTANDSTTYGQMLWAEITGGQYGAIGAYVPPTLTPSQQAANAINAGVILTSTVTPALNATYNVGATVQANLNATITYMLLNGNTFPGGATEMPWPDAESNMRIFPTAASFQAFASAVANFVAVVTLYANSNGTMGSIPSNAITIP